MTDCKGYSTKYALTKGIETVTAEIIGKFAYVGGCHRVRTQLVVGKTFFTQPAQAENAARTMAAKKANRLRSYLEKIEKLIRDPKWAESG